MKGALQLGRNGNATVPDCGIEKFSIQPLAYMITYLYSDTPIFGLKQWKQPPKRKKNEQILRVVKEQREGRPMLQHILHRLGEVMSARQPSHLLDKLQPLVSERFFASFIIVAARESRRETEKYSKG